MPWAFLEGTKRLCRGLARCEVGPIEDLIQKKGSASSSLLSNIGRCSSAGAEPLFYGMGSVGLRAD